MLTGGWEEDELVGGAVNLDAMIRREDFEAEVGDSTDQSRPGHELYIQSLTQDGRLASMRKPRFQRETSAWSPRIVAEFIRSVVDGDVIPAVIMWRSPLTGKIFVIDGAHRLSALIAWTSNDYGDRDISQPFFGYQIEPAQMSIANAARNAIETEVGTYRKLRSYVKSPDSAPDEKALKRSNNIMNNPIYIQWVFGDADAAERSFVRINSTAVAIDATEKILIETRKKPAGLAARALMHAGAGHEYWSKFPEGTRSSISTLAKDVYDYLIKPIVEYPVIALDLPSPDRGYSASSAKTVLDLVDYLNSNKDQQHISKVPDDVDGKETVKYLNVVKAATSRVFGRQHSGSLALHPGVYCFGVTGKFIPKAFIGAVAFIASLEKSNRFFEFTKCRAEFEQFLLDHKDFMNQIGSSQGSGGRRGIPSVIALYDIVFESVNSGNERSKIIDKISAHPKLRFLVAEQTELPMGGKRFTDDDKKAVLLRETLSAELTCPICKARLYRKDRSHDHIDRLQDGGTSSASNLQLTHPYCNTGYKEVKLAKEREIERKRA